MGGRIRVVVADDSFLVREGLALILGREPHVEVVAACADSPSLLAAVERERPQVVVADVRMPPGVGDEGVRVADELRATHPEIGVVLLSRSADPRVALALLAHGADGRACLLERRVHDRRQLVAAVEAVAHGGSLVDANVVETALTRRWRPAGSPLAALSPRELEVLGEIARGSSNGQIAADLVLTKRAVEKHVNAIFMKLGLSRAGDVSRRVKATLVYLAETGDRGR